MRQRLQNGIYRTAGRPGTPPPLLRGAKDHGRLCQTRVSVQMKWEGLEGPKEREMGETKRNLKGWNDSETGLN